MPSFGGSHGRSHGGPSGQEVPGDSKGEPRHQAHRGPSAIPCCRGREGAGPEAPGRLQEGSGGREADQVRRSEEHTSELQSLMRISYAVFCLKKKNKINTRTLKD